MSRYFKLLCLYDPPYWIVDEFQRGKARFGWSGPGINLHEISKKDLTTWSEAERTAWSHTKFLIQRIKIGYRVVIQPEQPIKRFLIGEVIDPGYDVSPDKQGDFNHFLHVRSLTPKPIPINSKAVS